MKLNSMHLNLQNQNDSLLIEKKTKKFSDIDNKILKENNFLQFHVEIELIPFGKPKFDVFNKTDKKVQTKKRENRKRYIDTKGNVFFLLKGKNKVI